MTLRLVVLGLLFALLASPAWSFPIGVTFAASDGSETASGSFVYEGNVSGAGSVAGLPYGGSIALPSASLAASEVRWIVQASGCATGGACVVLGLAEPLGGGSVHLAALLFSFTSLPSADLPDPATLAGAGADFLDVVLDAHGVVQELRFVGAVTSLSFSVPEPGMLALLALSGAAALSALRRGAA